MKKKKKELSMEWVDDRMETTNHFCSGNKSKPFWEDINKIAKRDRNVWIALYSIGCKLQEIEARLAKMTRKNKLKGGWN